MAKKKGKKRGGMSKQYFEDKRTKTFASLDTVAQDWEHAEVKDFKPLIRVNEETGEEKIVWIPEYTIPDGFVNPLKETDEQNDEHRHCQLCDHDIILYGVILNREKKYSLIVGMDCYELYETDDARNVRLTMLENISDEFFTKRLAEQKERCKAALAVYLETNKISTLDYAFYSILQREQTVDWSKAKFYNYICKHAANCRKIGFDPKLADLTANQYRKYLQNILIAEKYRKAKEKENRIREHIDYTNGNYSESYNEISNIMVRFRKQVSEIKKMGLGRIKQLVPPIQLV